MTDDEMKNALITGAVIRVSTGGEATVVTPDDLPPNVRECYRASRQRDRRHQSSCPDCLESEAEATETDAASHREDGNDASAQALEPEAEKLQPRRDDLTEKVVGVMCDLCGSHKAITIQEVEVRVTSRRFCDCGANSGEVSFYYICETPCSSPDCLCHSK
jgi:hypothetical protein